MAEMLVLESEAGQYVLSQVERSYECAPIFIGSLSRAIDGTLNQRKLALKAAHTVKWEVLPWEDTDAGIGLSTLRRLVSLSGITPFTLYVHHYPDDESEPEEYTVMIDPESFQYRLVRWLGERRRYWEVSVTFLEV